MPTSFDAESAEFSREMALHLAHASDVAYLREPEQEARARLGMRVFPFRNRVTRVRGFVGVCESHAVLAFRGTEPTNLPNWVTDAVISLATKGDYEGRVHAGFSTVLSASWQEILGALEHARGLPLLVTGHSMGGALGALAATRLAGRKEPLRVYTFGSPRFGDVRFCESYRTPTFRMVNHLDIVPELPLAGFRKFLPTRPRLTNETVLKRLHRLADRLPSYGHVRMLGYIDAEHRVVLDDEVKPWHSAAVVEAIANRGAGFITGISDHLIGNYIRALGGSGSGGGVVGGGGGAAGGG